MNDFIFLGKEEQKKKNKKKLIKRLKLNHSLMNFMIL